MTDPAQEFTSTGEAIPKRQSKSLKRDMPIEGQKKSVYGKWRAAAFKVNDNWGPPDSRPIPLLTPPIEGFDASLYMDAEDET